MFKLISIDRIWDTAPHNAFTDLIRVNDGWLCTFREAEAHAVGQSTIRVLRYDDGDGWTSLAAVREQDVDLRDPKLSVMPDGRLLLLMGGSTYDENGRYRTRSPRVAFSSDAGATWTKPTRVLAEDHWLWRVTWHGDVGYAVSKLGEGTHPRRGFLYRTRDGLDWEWITEFFLPDDTWTASETTLRFVDDRMIALVRPDWIGASDPPYTNWRFSRIRHTLGGPNFIRLPDGTLIASGRVRNPEDQPETVLAVMTERTFDPVFTLPSGGDNSYAGMVWHDETLWVSYYSSHEGKSSIYLARLERAG